MAAEDDGSKRRKTRAQQTAPISIEARRPTRAELLLWGAELVPVARHAAGNLLGTISPADLAASWSLKTDAPSCLVSYGASEA